MTKIINRVFSNGPLKDFVLNPFNRLIEESKNLYLAAPYFTMAGPIVQAAQAGKSIRLLIGLNFSTSPQALSLVHGISNLSVRYLTRRFHAKIYIFDHAALIGSSNLTDGGLISNREAVVCLDRAEDSETVEEIRGLFGDLWESAQVLTDDKLKIFQQTCAAINRKGDDPDAIIEKAVGRAEPVNVYIGSKTKTRERVFLDGLQRQIYEQYRPAFNEVTEILEKNGFRRPELENIGNANETNRFLNWVRKNYAIGDDAWQLAPLRSQDERQNEISRLGREWATTDDSKIPEDYIEWLRVVQRTFGTTASIEAASKEDLTQGLMSVHAFLEQLRFVKGGEVNLPEAFWAANNHDVTRVKRWLIYLVHGEGEFIQRLHDVLYGYSPEMKPGRFGLFCALELYGTIKPKECPPMNGRMAKALRYLGFDVRGT